ncbi:MAG: signal peptidase I [Coriobacteriales bacterium]|jgi:signal peptidase I|nr:signal peptidase I [Coriobacteriales bacterium]
MKVGTDGSMDEDNQNNRIKPIPPLMGQPPASHQMLQMEPQDFVKKPRKYALFRSLLPYIIIVLVVFLVVGGLRVSGTIDNYEVPSGSMEDTVMTGSLIMTENVQYWFRQPEPGDVIVFKDKLSSKDLLKRVIATAGDTVNLVNGKVVVNGKALSEPYTDGKPSLPLTTAPGITITYPHKVAANCIWVMGDNRTNSSDSRYFGDVPLSNVITQAWFVYSPLNEMHFL